MKELIARLDRPTRMMLAFLVLVLVALIWDQQHWWRLRDEYLFGFLVPVFVAWVMRERLGLWRMSLDPAAPRGRDAVERGWSRRLQAARRAPLPGWIGRVLELAAMGAALVGFLGLVFAALYRAMESHNLVTTQLLTMATGLLVLAGGYLFLDRRFDGERIPTRERLMMVGLLLFPATIWMLSAPLFNFLDSTIRTFLMNKVAVVVFAVFDLVGYPIVREGSVLVLPTGQVGVEEACSGIYSLMASLFAGSFLAATCFRPGWGTLWKKIAMVLLAMIFAFLTNIGRSFFLTAWAYRHGPDAIDEPVQLLGIGLGSLHDLLGYAIIVPVVVALRLLVPLFNFSFEIPDEGPRLKRIASGGS